MNQCRNLEEGYAPLPRTLDDIKSKLNFLKSQVSLAKTTSQDLLKDFGFGLSGGELSKLDPIESEAQVIAQQISYQCLQEAVKESDSIGLASHTYIPTIESLFLEFDEGSTVSERVKIYGHHWNVYSPKVTIKDNKTTVCGHIEHNVAYNQNDTLDYKLVLLTVN